MGNGAYIYLLKNMCVYLGVCLYVYMLVRLVIVMICRRMLSYKQRNCHHNKISCSYLQGAIDKVYGSLVFTHRRRWGYHHIIIQEFNHY